MNELSTDTEWVKPLEMVVGTESKSRDAIMDGFSTKTQSFKSDICEIGR